MGGGGDFSGGVGALSVGTGHEEGRGCDDEGTGDRHGGGRGVEGIKHDLRCGATVGPVIQCEFSLGLALSYSRPNPCFLQLPVVTK